MSGNKFILIKFILPYRAKGWIIFFLFLFNFYLHIKHRISNEHPYQQPKFKRLKVQIYTNTSRQSNVSLRSNPTLSQTKVCIIPTATRKTVYGIPKNIIVRIIAVPPAHFEVNKKDKTPSKTLNKTLNKCLNKTLNKTQCWNVSFFLFIQFIFV